MVTRLTTLDRCKRRAAIRGQEDDTLILEVLDEVCADVETYVGRHVQRMGRTETYRLRAFENVIKLVGYPVDSISEVKYHDRTDEWADVTATDAELYTLDSDTGTLRLRNETPYHPGYARVTYTGGLVAASGDDADTVTAAFIAAYPNIAGAVDQQIVEVLRRRKTPTGSVQFGRSQSSQRYEMGLLRDVRRRLNTLKRMRVL